MTGKDGKEYLGTGWPGVSATLLGTADNGNKVFKWVSAQTTAPNNIIFSGGGNQTSDLVFTNGGYYTKDGQQDVVTTTGIQEVRRQMSDGSYKIYDLQGRRISQMPSSGRPQKGLYIVNGRKIII
jgi:alpha-amylase